EPLIGGCNSAPDSGSWSTSAPTVVTRERRQLTRTFDRRRNPPDRAREHPEHGQSRHVHGPGETKMLSTFLQGRDPRSFTPANHHQSNPLLNGCGLRMSCSSEACGG